MKALIEVNVSTILLHLSKNNIRQTGIPLAKQSLSYMGNSLDDDKTIEFYNMNDGDVLTLQEASDANLISKIASDLAKRFQVQQSQSLISDAEVDTLFATIEQRPGLLNQMQREDPEMYEAIINKDRMKIKKRLEEKQSLNRQQENKRRKLINDLNSNPYDIEKQRIIEEMIYGQQIDEQMYDAVEHNPEVFGEVFMLYIDTEVNKIPIKSFVDTGAQNTIMSQECAERCGLMKYVDKRFRGMAQGIGTSKILGRVHRVMLKIGNSFFANSVIVLESVKGIDFILGLDLMKRHQCIIDLKDNLFRIGSEATPFLSEKDIPRYLNKSAEELNYSSNPTPSYDENVIKNLVELGHSREAVIEALDACNGNAELAGTLLLERLEK